MEPISARRRCTWVTLSSPTCGAPDGRRATRRQTTSWAGARGALAECRRAARHDRERAADLSGVRPFRPARAALLSQPVRRRPHPGLGPAGRLVGRRPQLALRAGVALRDHRVGLPWLPGRDGRVALPALPPAGYRPRRADAALLSATPQDPPPARQAQ